MSIVRGCIDTDYMLRISNQVVNHYMLLFYALKVAGFVGTFAHPCVYVI